MKVQGRKRGRHNGNESTREEGIRGMKVQGRRKRGRHKGNESTREEEERKA